MSRKRLAKVQVILIALVVAMTGCRHKEEQQLPIVIVDKPSKEDVQIYGEYVGRIRAASFVEVHARVEGFLEKMLFEEGKRVKQNEPLFMINPDKYRARVEKAKAQLKKSQAQAAKARRDVERLKPLYEQHAASQLDLDNATAALEDAEAKMTALDYLRAERRNVKFGEQDTTRSWQPTVTVTLADDSEYPVKGIVDFADPLVDPKTGTFGVRAELSNPNQKLLPGQFTKVKLLLDVRERSIVVPRKALSIEKGGAFIYIIRRDDIAEKRFVQTGPEIGNKVVIERGLGENERVVVEGYHKLVPGVKVHAVEAGDEKAIQALREEEEQ